MLILEEQWYNSVVMKNPNQTWNKYLKNKNVRPKVFRATIVRNEDGTFQLLGNETRMLNVINQYSDKWVSVDTRDFAATLNRSKIKAL